ncbi:hypothetical protein JHK87_034010 [Glycine soja]|nr:hypothetical protein JHK87_034010 [Glycine soja]
MSFGRSLLPFCCFKSYVVDSHINGTGNLINHLLKKCLKFPKESLDPSQQTFAFAQMKKEDGKGTNSVLTNVHFDVNGASRQALARIINVVELYFKFVEKVVKFGLVIDPIEVVGQWSSGPTGGSVIDPA